VRAAPPPQGASGPQRAANGLVTCLTPRQTRRFRLLSYGGGFRRVPSRSMGGRCWASIVGGVESEAPLPVALGGLGRCGGGGKPMSPPPRLCLVSPRSRRHCGLPRRARRRPGRSVAPTPPVPRKRCSRPGSRRGRRRRRRRRRWGSVDASAAADVAGCAPAGDFAGVAVVPDAEVRRLVGHPRSVRRRVRS
jgi:hypothetical protein